MLFNDLVVTNKLNIDESIITIQIYLNIFKYAMPVENNFPKGVMVNKFSDFSFKTLRLDA
jgi:hypothetical protein